MLKLSLLHAKRRKLQHGVPTLSSCACMHVSAVLDADVVAFQDLVLECTRAWQWCCNIHSAVRFGTPTKIVDVMYICIDRILDLWYVSVQFACCATYRPRGLHCLGIPTMPRFEQPMKYFLTESRLQSIVRFDVLNVIEAVMYMYHACVSRRALNASARP